MTSVLNVDTIADKAGTGPVGLTKQSAAKAWINLDAVSSNAIRDSLNVSSMTDVATGEQRWSFVNNMNNNYWSGKQTECGIHGRGSDSRRRCVGGSANTS